jgi:hypothetical protein
MIYAAHLLSSPFASPLHTRPAQTLTNTCQHTDFIGIPPTHRLAGPSSAASLLVSSDSGVGHICAVCNVRTEKRNQARSRQIMPGMRRYRGAAGEVISAATVD